MATRFDFIGMAVADMAATLTFYRRLGLDVPADADTQPHVEATLPGGIRIGWDTIDNIRSFEPDWEPHTGNGIGLGFACDSPAEVDKAYTELVQAGYKGRKEPWDAFWGQRYATILDPDGNSVDLFAPLPSSD
jgi:catechol 2,3-dioxygenase-like lactoylglutathione lyase family enzyme